MKRLVAGCGLLVLCWAGVALAHNRGSSYSEWTLDGARAEVRARVPQLELTRLQLHPSLPGYAEAAGAHLAGALQLWSRSGRCAPGPVATQVVGDGWVYARWTVQCAEADALVLRSALLHDVAPSHLHLARVNEPGAAGRELLLTYGAPAAALRGGADAGASFAGYVALGLQHILSGWDHLAFVLALILLARRVAEVALLVTGFTVAHSVTLAAAVLGWTGVQAGAVEALIGFSIALVAAENLWLRARRERWLPRLLAGLLAGLAILGATHLPGVLLAGLALFTACYFALARDAAQPLRLRIAVAFAFGLVHGFGFAGALAPLQLPPDRLAAGLLGFNSGVELGQLLVVAVAWPVLKALERRPALRRWTGDGVSAGLCALGTFWFVMRAFG